MPVSCGTCGKLLPDGSRVCTSCGHELAVTGVAAGGKPLAIVRAYFRDLYEVIFTPTKFFRRMPVTGGLSVPLAFALVTHWLGSAVSYLWTAAMGGALARQFDSLFQMAGDVADVDSPGRSQAMLELKDRIYHWALGAGSVTIDPFITLLTILFTSFFVFMGARMLVTPGKNGAPAPITFESAARIVCYGMTPSILAAVPLVGSLLAALLTWTVTVIAAREVYRVPNGRAVVIAFFPKLLFAGLFFAMIAALFVVVLKMLAF